MSLGVIYTPKDGAKARILKTEPAIHAIMDGAAANIRDAAMLKSYDDGHPCTYHVNQYTDKKGFHHSDVFISWKRKSAYYQRAVDHLRNSI